MGTDGGALVLSVPAGRNFDDINKFGVYCQLYSVKHPVKTDWFTPRDANGRMWALFIIKERYVFCPDSSSPLNARVEAGEKLIRSPADAALEHRPYLELSIKACKKFDPPSELHRWYMLDFHEKLPHGPRPRKNRAAKMYFSMDDLRDGGPFVEPQ